MSQASLKPSKRGQPSRPHRRARRKAHRNATESTPDLFTEMAEASAHTRCQPVPKPIDESLSVDESLPVPPPTVSEVLRRYLPSLKPDLNTPFSREDIRRYRVMYELAHCRSGQLGAMPFTCEGCGDRQLRLRSCGDRHCPTCNGRKRRQWRKDLVEWSLDCDYLHIVFTLPHELNPVIAANAGILHRLQFRCVTDVLQQTTSREYGCKVGLVEVLHTWGQQLGQHVHIHVVMTAGGLTPKEDRWVPISGDDEVMSREVLAAKFRKTYLRRLKSLVRRGEIDWDEADAVLETVAAKDWVVNVQKPPPHCQGAEAVINYLGSYVIGGPIGDGRIISDIDGMVTFRFQNYATGKVEFSEIPGAEFVRRFALHILPSRMSRLRYSGLFQASGRTARLLKCQRLIDAANLSRGRSQESHSAARLLGEEHDQDHKENAEEEQPAEDPSRCRQCGDEMKTRKEEWLGDIRTLVLLKIVAEILLGLRRDGESLLMQMITALLAVNSRPGVNLSDTELQLVESMLMECHENPEPLLRGYLGRHHPLLREAAKREARPPPTDESETADA